jgi:DNA-binding MarR family transcriptional regulator
MFSDYMTRHRSTSLGGVAKATRWLDDDEQHTWRQWTHLTSELNAALQRGLQDDAGLSVPDFQVLVELSESPDGVRRISELATALQWEQSRLSHHVKRMQARGLVTRENCADDGRGAMVRLTPQGRGDLERAAPGHAELVRRLFVDVLTREELLQLGAMLERLRAAGASLSAD